jgi:hypothetical protein
MVTDVARDASSSKVERPFQQHPASVFIRRRFTHVPTTVAERALPLQNVERVKKANIEEIRKRLNEEKQKRFDYCLDLLFNPFRSTQKKDAPIVSVPFSTGCTEEHAQKQAQTVVAERVSEEMEAADPSRGFVRVFSVVEQEKQRQRLIHWTKSQNERAYDVGYKCAIDDIDHISAYLPAVYADCASTADIHASFYHVELPPEVRAFYRFRDSVGKLYQLRVGAMGHCVMPEIMQIVTNVLAGNPAYVKDSFAIHAPVQVWIDNVRHYGSRSLVMIAREAMQRNAETLNLEVKIDALKNEYEFVGVRFNHEKKTVRVADKTLNKLPSSIPASLKARDIETLVGRLIFVAGVRQEPLVNNWWCLKWARRVMNGLNSGRLQPEDTVNIQPSARHTLQHWLARSRDMHKVVVAKQGPSVTLFTDATPSGYGAVLVTDDNRVYATGGRFKEYQQKGSIATQEAFAICNAFHDFADKLRKVGRINLFVDNTSVQAVAAVGNPKAPDLVEPVKELWQFVIKTKVQLLVSYISTKTNPADEISRGRPVDVDKIELATRQSKEEIQTKQNKRQGKKERRFVGTTSL